ncbi:MAG: SLC13 family permease [Steroidobacteraceae bacterium]
MSVALVTVLALVAALALSVVSRTNIGIIALAAAWLIGVYVAQDAPKAVIAGFPLGLFITLTGTSLLFAVVALTGVLARLAAAAVAALGNSVRALPLVFFAIAMLVSASGAGAIASVALIVPLAATMARQHGLPPMLTALMVANGANAGNLSPVSVVGIIANSRMAEAGIVGHETLVMMTNLLVHVLVAAAAYAWFMLRSASPVATGAAGQALPRTGAWSSREIATLLVLMAWIAGVLIAGFDLGLSAFAAAAILILARCADEAATIRHVPWGVILMVCGVATLVALAEANGGTELFAKLIAAVATPGSINAIIAFVTGVISSYSSTSGVVLPTFLPVVPELVRQLGGGDPLAIALSINVGASLVDVSPLSTLGALCIASLTDGDAGRALFHRLLIWGFAMTLVSALFCLWVVPWLAGSFAT